MIPKCPYCGSKDDVKKCATHGKNYFRCGKCGIFGPKQAALPTTAAAIADSTRLNALAQPIRAIVPTWRSSDDAQRDERLRRAIAALCDKREHDLWREEIRHEIAKKREEIAHLENGSRIKTAHEAKITSARLKHQR